LFCAYLEYQHDGRMIREFEGFRAFLYDSPVETVEFNYFAGDTLVAVSIADMCSQSLSSVYVFFSPDEAGRSLGVYSALWEIEFCRRQRIPYYYLGLYVRAAPTMSYKDRFRPCEIKDRDGRWRPANAPDAVKSA
jgi:arginine-tRNA-protein transferase